MILKLDSAEVEKAIDQLRSVAKTVIRGQGGKQLASLSGFSNAGGLDEAGAVSYTHLTLPTKA